MLTQKQVDTRKRMAKERHETALKDYRENPKLCQQCENIIPLGKGSAPVAEARRKRFCSRSCAAKFNNRKFPKRKSTLSETGICEECGTELRFTKGKSRSYNVRRFCDGCRRNRRLRSLPRPLEKMTLGELTSMCGRLQARTRITKSARATYVQGGKPEKCQICGFNFCFDVAHIKQVTSFDKATLISEINSLENLIALCPNHHRMYDGGVIDLSMAVIDELAKS